MANKTLQRSAGRKVPVKEKTRLKKKTRSGFQGLDRRVRVTVEVSFSRVKNGKLKF